MKAQKGKKNLGEFDVKTISPKQLNMIVGGRGNSIIIEDAEGI